MRSDLQRLINAAREAVREASVAILAIYATDFAVRAKSDLSPVTEADERAEGIIRAALRAAAPDIPMIGEESVAEDAAAPRGAFWLVDPLDGTREFVAKNGEFTVNIGLVETGASILGVIHVPVKNTTYWGAGAGTAMCQEGDAAPVAIAARPVPSRAPIVTHSRSHRDEGRLSAYIGALAEARTLISGSSVKFCLLAEGSADLYPRLGATCEWDTCAGQAILEAAGGRVETLDGNALRYGKPKFLNPDFIARGR